MKKIISTILVCVMIFALSITAFADDTTYSYGHFYYHDHDGYVSISGYLGSETDITIPASIAGKPVSEIESGAFDNADSAQTITVPDTVVITYPDSFAGADSLGRIICESGDTPVTAPAGVNVQYPEVTTTTTTTMQTAEPVQETTSGQPVTTSGGYSPVWSDIGNNVTTPAVTESTSDTTQQPVITQDEDIGDFAYEEDGLPEEIETVVAESISESTSVSGKKTEKTTSSETVSTSATTAVTTIVITPENVVSVSVNDAGQLVGIDERGAETVLEPEKTYSTEQQPDGSVKIMDEDGEELVIAVGDIQIAETTQETTAETASAGTSAASPSQQTASSDNGIVIVIIAIVAAVIVIAVVIVIVMIKKRR